MTQNENVMSKLHMCYKHLSSDYKLSHKWGMHDTTHSYSIN